MALAPRSSLRPLVLLMSHGKPQLSAFFSSSSSTVTEPQATPGCDTTAAPAVKPPATPGCSNTPAIEPPSAPVPPSSSSDGPFEEPKHPIPSGPTRIFQKPSMCILKDPEPIPVGSCGTLQPVAATGGYTTAAPGCSDTPAIEPPSPPVPPSGSSYGPLEKPIHPIPGGPRRIHVGPCSTFQPVAAPGGYAPAAPVVKPPAAPRCNDTPAIEPPAALVPPSGSSDGIFEEPKHPIPGGRIRIFEKLSTCILEAPEPIPVGSCSTLQPVAAPGGDSRAASAVKPPGSPGSDTPAIKLPDALECDTSAAPGSDTPAIKPPAARVLPSRPGENPTDGPKHPIPGGRR